MKRLGLLLLVLSLIPSLAAGQEDSWNVYLDASSFNRIIPSGDTLWCATNGGILLYDLGDSTFSQYMSGLDLRSSRITSVAVDDDGSIWIGHRASGIDRIDGIDSDPFVKHYDAALDLIQSDSITSIVAAGDDIYYGSSNGVAKFYNNLPSPESGLTAELEDIYVHDLLHSGDTLWIASDAGVGLFERVTLQLTLFDTGRVTSLCRHGGSVYTAGENGVQRFVAGAVPGWEQVGTLDEVPLTISSGGGVLGCATPAAVYLWNGSGWDDIAGDESTPGSLKYVIRNEYRIRTEYDILTTIAVDRRGTPWIGGIQEIENRGAYLNGYIDGRWRSEAPALLTQNEVIELGLDPAGGIWTSSLRYGISYLSDAGRWTSYTKYRGDVPGDTALSFYAYNLALLFDSQGYLWLNAPGADLDRIQVSDPFRRDDDVWTHFSLGDGTLTSNRFVKAKEDPEGNRWFLSDDVGRAAGVWGINIVNAAGDEWLTVNPDSIPEMEGGSVFDCAFGEDGRVYLGLRGYGVQVWFPGGYDWAELSETDDDIWYTLIGPDPLTSKIVHSIAFNEENGLFLGTASGLYRYRSGSIDSLIKKSITNPRGLVGTIVYDLEFDGEGNLWIASDGGLDKLNGDGDVVETYTTADHWSKGLEFLYANSIISPLTSNICRALEYDEAENALWIGTDNGLVRFDLTPPQAEEIPLSRLILYPNPVHVSRGDDALRIWRISGPVDIKVYNLEGELVHEASRVAEGEVAWDLLTINGYVAESGVYIVRVSARGMSEMKKIALVR